MRVAAINLRARPEQRDLIDRVFFGLDVEKFRQFTKLLDAPPARNPRLERLMAVRAPWGTKTPRV